MCIFLTLSVLYFDDIKIFSAFLFLSYHGFYTYVKFSPEVCKIVFPFYIHIHYTVYMFLNNTEYTVQ